MKYTRLLSLGLLLASTLSSAHAANSAGGPKGGRLLDATPHPLEFLVTTDRRAEIFFYDSAQKPTAPANESVSLIAETTSGRTKIEMKKTPTGFISEQSLPAGEPYRVVVQFRSEPTAKPQNFRVELNLAKCGTCDRAEYACVCEGH